MWRPAPDVCLTLLFVTMLSATILRAQSFPTSALPPTTPTQTISDLPSAHPALTTAAGAASVSWSSSLLTIQGKGDSLRNVLRAVSQETGLKITGGVPEEPVFGSYGPGSVQDVLPQLFEGSKVNMMLVNDGAIRPRELVLTQRTGAASPPQTTAIADEDQGFRRRRPVPQGNGNGFTPPSPSMPNPSAQPNQNGGGQPPSPAVAPGSDATQAAPAAAVDANGQPASPNGVRTPEQIFEELRKRQQQQQNATPQ